MYSNQCVFVFMYVQIIFRVNHTISPIILHVGENCRSLWVSNTQTHDTIFTHPKHIEYNIYDI